MRDLTDYTVRDLNLTSCIESGTAQQLYSGGIRTKWTACLE